MIIIDHYDGILGAQTTSKSYNKNAKHLKLYGT